MMKKLKKKRKKDYNDDNIEFESFVEHLRVIVTELESSNFENIREVLGMEPSVQVECAIATMIALAGSTRSEGAFPSSHRK